MSVDWAELSTPGETYARWERWGEGRRVGAITAQLCWNNQQLIAFAPTPENPAHTEIVDQPGATIGKDRLRKNLAKGAKLIISRSAP